ncbi:M3 family oligoendopeptidase [Sulfurospirillum diekertiae]|uniref:Oligoendopeptidase F, plasmid n=1 Tax=Sulfurospirillum diekertiae TaxID=1854492 RepID=A0A1Y0HME1_9BACT|nr:M3 family oligoendopeptidase [Sulfurospirillum diekertiae]ARU49261.1 Oligoendopeptidase F, plasmid [Sulfurospirillum diekertiae]ASC94071.1 Oligoendopeptidase F, plasmid [Sulfurospirillum diekertiae]
MNWDLSALYENETVLEADLRDAASRAKSFASVCKGKLKELHVNEFLESIREYESINETLGCIMTYAFLKFATNSDNGGFYAKYQQAHSTIAEDLLFFELEFNKLSKPKQEELIAATPTYKYYLESLMEEKPYQLSQKEERILLKKEMTSSSAFSRLFDEHFSRLKFSYEGEKLSEEEILSKLQDSNREVRQKVASAFTKGLKPHQPLLAYIFNMIKTDLASECELRGYKNAEQSRHMDNKITQKSVDALVKSAESSFYLVQDYYVQKAKLLGLAELYEYDRYAPLEESTEKFDFQTSKKIVLDAFKKFNPKFYEIASMAFEKGWIDVFPKDKKRGGAFSHPATPSTHPYVLLNHTDTRRDLFTLAHELGHAIHQYLSRDVGYLGSDTPLTTSETASVFAEMLAFDAIKDNLSMREKRSLYASKIEDIFSTLYRQINFTTFERKVHAHEGELDLETFNQYWMQESQKMFGKSITLTKDYALWWSYIPHFIHSPFYCYAYSYGQLLVLALYGLYKKSDKAAFVQNYTSFLSAGGSQSPKELIKKFGFDIEDEHFWQLGISEIESLLAEFKGMCDA